MSSSLTDVARVAEVSVATASRVLSGSRHPVSDETRRRVMEVAKALSYRPNGSARALVTKRSTIIGVIVGDIVDPYFSEITRGADDVAREHGFLTMVCNTEGEPEVELAHVRALNGFPAAGIIFAGSGRMTEDEVERSLVADVGRAVALGTRVVSLARRSFEGEHVLIDNVAVCRDVTRYLISIGHRRIAFIEGPHDLHTSFDRRTGFDDAMKDAGLAPHAIYRGGFSHESGAGAARRILADGLPDAVVAANDIAAIGAMMTLREAGVDVPGKVSIAGIDDTQPAHLVGLTTVRVPLGELGAAGAAAIVDPERTTRGDMLQHEIVVRATTLPRPGA